MSRAATLAIGLATLLLALGYALAASWPGAAASLAIGGAWLVGLRRAWPAAGALGLLGLAGAAAAGVALGVAGPLALVAVAAALAGWDLERFAARIRGASGDTAAVERAHLRQLLGILGAGLLLGALALALRLALSFGAALLLAALAIVALGRAFRLLRRAEE